MNDENRSSEQKPFYKRLEFIASLLYGIFIGGYTLAFIFIDPDKKVLLTSNELGDFLAGIFSPLAFLFLYLGYKRQGKDAEENSKAIQQQIKELANGVMEQQRLIRIYEQELQYKKEAAKPIFYFKDTCFDHRKIEFITNDEYIPMQQSISFQLENSGALVHSVNLIKDNFIFQNIPVLKDSTPVSCILSLSNKEEQQLYQSQELKIDFDIEFTDTLGNKNVNNYVIELFDIVEGDAGDDYYFTCNIIKK